MGPCPKGVGAGSNILGGSGLAYGEAVLRSAVAWSIRSTASRPVMPAHMPRASACGVTPTIFASNKSSGSTNGLAGVPFAMAMACPNSAAVFRS